jgi:hypothetical protein
MVRAGRPGSRFLDELGLRDNEHCLSVWLKGSTIRITPPSDTRGSDRRARPFVRPAFRAANSVNAYVRPLRSLVIWLIDEGLLTSDPFRRSRRRAALNPLLPSEETPTKSATLDDIRALEAGCAGDRSLARCGNGRVWRRPYEVSAAGVVVGPASLWRHHPGHGKQRWAIYAPYLSNRGFHRRLVADRCVCRPSLGIESPMWSSRPTARPSTCSSGRFAPHGLWARPPERE